MPWLFCCWWWGGGGGVVGVCVVCVVCYVCVLVETVSVMPATPSDEFEAVPHGSFHFWSSPAIHRMIMKQSHTTANFFEEVEHPPDDLEVPPDYFESCGSSPKLLRTMYT